MKSVRRRVSRGWRAFRTGVAFAAFGVGGLLLACTMLPMFQLLPGARQVNERRAQRLVHLAFRLFVWFMETLRLIRVTRIGTDRLRTTSAVVVIANHPTLIDVVLLIACMPRADCVVKRRAWSNLFLRGVIAGVGYIPNDAGQPLVEACVKRLRAGRSILLFPEGTRSAEGRLGPFRRGAARIALESGCDLVSVIITCDPPTLMKGQKWYDVPERTPHLVLKVEEPIALKGYRRVSASDGLEARRLTADLRAMYLAKLGYTESFDSSNYERHETILAQSLHATR
jgi:1-acyl-sn-glycerol-3-phosphate acyltransferase